MEIQNQQPQNPLDISAEIERDLDKEMANIKEADLFNPSTELDNNILFRTPQFDSILKNYMLFWKYSRRVNYILYGPRGSGKTALSKHAAKTMETKGIKSFYINCNLDRTSTAMMGRISAIDEGVQKPGRQHGNEAFAKFKTTLSKYEKVIIIFDEFDQILDDRILYFLTRDNEFSNVLVTLITNQPSAQDVLTLNVKSGLKPKIIPFPPYSAEQLNHILVPRAREGLNDYNDDHLKTIAAINAAQFHGDARVGIMTLGSYNPKEWDKADSDFMQTLLEHQRDQMLNATISILDQRQIKILYYLLKFNMVHEAYTNHYEQEVTTYTKDYFMRFVKELEELGVILTFKKTKELNGDSQRTTNVLVAEVQGSDNVKVLINERARTFGVQMR